MHDRRRAPLAKLIPWRIKPQTAGEVLEYPGLHQQQFDVVMHVQSLGQIGQEAEPLNPENIQRVE